MTEDVRQYARDYMRGLVERRAEKFGLEAAITFCQDMLSVSPCNERETEWDAVCLDYLREHGRGERCTDDGNGHGQHVEERGAT